MLALGLDELSFRDTAGGYNVIPGYMPSYITAAIGTIGFALAFLPSRRL